MVDIFYLEADTKVIDNKTKYGRFRLYNYGEYIKTFSVDESRVIRKRMEIEKIKVKHYQGSITIDDYRFVNQITRLKLVNKRKPKKKLLYYIAGTSILLMLSSGFINNKNKNTNESNIVHASEIEESTFDENDYITEITTEQKIEPTTEQVIEPTTEQVIIPEEPVKIIDNGFDDIFSFNYQDRSSNENVNTVYNNYNNSIEYYSNIYGVDSKLISAIICQENPNNIKNYDMYAGHGVPQIEAIWNNSEVYAYNFDTNQTESSGPIDVMRCVNDQDYSIKLSCMILNSYYNTIHRNYGNKLSPQEELCATVWAYNKGITSICEALNNSDDYYEFKDYVLNKSYGGDNEYLEHVFSYIQDEDIIKMKSKDGIENKILIDNTTIENKKPIVR